jgi:hypothetical protein
MLAGALAHSSSSSQAMCRLHKILQLYSADMAGQCASTCSSSSSSSRVGSWQKLQESSSSSSLLLFQTPSSLA